MQKISQISFSKKIAALSPSPMSSAVFTATQGGIQCLDTRTLNSTPLSVSIPGYPLSLLSSSFSPTTISVSGRFPSVLTYDTRYFPALLDSTYSGAHSLSSLFSLPSRNGIIAAGEYNGRGTLEFLSSSPSSKAWVNRYSASRSALLCLAQPSWTNEIIYAGSADGAIRCFDVSLDGSHVRELAGPDTAVRFDGGNLEIVNDLSGGNNDLVMISQILPLNTRDCALLVDGKLKILDSGRLTDDDLIDPNGKSKSEVSDVEIAEIQMDQNIRRAVRREMFGMLNLNAVLVSF